MDVFAEKLAELRARKDNLTEREQEALDTGDAEILVLLCPEELPKPKKVRESAAPPKKG